MNSEEVPTNEYGIRMGKPIVDYDIPWRVVSELMGDKTYGWQSRPDPDETLRNMIKFYDWWQPRMSDLTRKYFFEELPQTQDKVYEEQQKIIENNHDYI